MPKSTTRVHLLAKELGVKSKSIVEKCQAEGLDVKNHMSTISAGLAATIREWFSEGEHATTVERAEKVDLKKVRVRKKRKKAVKKDETATRVETTTEPLAVAEGQAETVAEPAKAKAKPKAKAKAKAKPKAKAKAKPKAKAKAKPKAKAKDKTKVEPEPIVPAGPMLEKPKPAELAGPKVVRVEKVEPHEVRPPKPKTSVPGRPRYDEPISEPLIVPGMEIPGLTKGKRGAKEKTRGRRKDQDVISEEAKRARLFSKRMRARDFEERQARLAAARGETLRSRPVRRIETKHPSEVSPVERPEKAVISEPITVKDLSAVLAVKSGDIIEKLMGQGVMATANQVISTEVAELVALDFGTELIVELKQTLQTQIEAEFKSRERKNLQRRPPVVTMLGHVDHGKTSLLDRIRSTNVAKGEAGGITQHTGAYQVEWKGRKVTFLDTPGHEAFTAMRARGANVTDIVVLVVAADDGVMPQTVEAIHHVEAAGVDMIVALNKIDLAGVDINRVYGQLSEHGLTPTEWGGQVEVCKTSALTGEGIEDLIEHLDYIAELREFTSDSQIPATGWVIEAKMTPTRGAVATILVKEGVVNKGDIVLAGGGYGRVRTLRDSRGKSIKKATSSMPAEISGLSDVPQAGDRFFCIDDINKAKEAAEQNKMRTRQRSLARRSRITLDNLFSQIEAGNIKELNLVIKADVQGSVDVLTKYLNELSTDEVKIRILHAAVGGISEGDVVLADASEAIVIGFNVVPDDRVREIAESSGVDIRLYNVIYRITEDLKDAMAGLLEPEFEENELGKAVVRNTFKISGLGTVAGCHVNSGVINKSAKVKLIRDNIVIKDKCSIESLRHFKDDVREVKAGLECGIKIAGFDDVKIDDVLEAYEIVEVARTL
ncbi:MAG TPA: translation initiation factor IF-2 [Planctomycetes bacterium]|nr:translation initiation factor IF-2 [Planctomycetota bacterium]HIJ70000.1 translation initiation factor IF-2 [Planctomycetota bacterium]